VNQKQKGGIFEKRKRSGVWWIDYRDSLGKRHREKVGGRADAMAAYSRRLQEIAENRYVDPRSRLATFKTVALARNSSKRDHLAARSLETDVQRAEVLFPIIGHIRIDQLTAEKLEDVFAQLKRGGLTGSTVNRYRSFISSVFSFALRRRIVRANPCQAVKRFKESDGRIRYLRPEEEKDLRRIISLHFEDRERRGEQFGLKWEDVDLDANILMCSGKTGRRHVFINPDARAAIEKLGKLSARKTPFVCPDTKDEKQRDWRRWFVQACRMAGVKNFRWHDLRHTFASRLVMGGASLRSVQEFLGHKSILMTMRYAHLSPDHRAAEIQKIRKDEQ
jgi:site-specific recombinase XerD